MSTITLYAWGVDGVYSGAIDVDPMGPVPARSTLAPPPEAPEGRVARWVGAWVVSDPPAPAQLSLDALKARLTTAATAHRWAVETGGITLPGGIEIKTGIDDQARITSVIANARLAGVTSVDFKAASGWVTLTIEQIEGITAAIALHVQACFAAERGHHEAIEALSDIEIAQDYDVAAGWPP